MLAYLAAVLNVFLELAPWLLVGLAVAGALHVLLPEGFVARNLRGAGGVVRAVAIGVPLPLCSCGVIPAGLGLRRDGASDGATVAFLISTPQTGVDSVLVSSGFLGWPFAIFKVLSAAVLGLVGGLATERWGGSGAPAAAPLATSHTRRTWRDGVSHALEVLDPIAVWLVVGVLLSAAITVFVPRDVMAGMGGAGTALAYVVVLAISVPLYVCATASVPIAASLIGAGFPPGAALVFLVAGPATNAATVGAVYRAFGGRTFAIYLGTIVFGSLALGVSFDGVVPVSTADCCVPGHAHGPSFLDGAAATILLGLLLRPTVTRLLRKTAPTAATRHIEVGVDGMNCGGCVNSLEGKLLALPGVTTVKVWLTPMGGASVSGDVSEEQVRAAIREAGYSPR